MADHFRNEMKNKELANQLIQIIKCSETETEVVVILRSMANKIGSYSKAGIASHSKQGNITYDNGAVYVGGFKVDKKHDQCSYEFTSGDKKHGQGKYTFASGDVYEGGYKDDKIHGQGKYTFASGDVYEGGYEDDKIHGQGKYTFANGDVYEGGYEDDKIHGQGKYTSAEGAVYIGKWESGIYQLKEEGEEEKSEMGIEIGLKDDKDNQRKKRDGDRDRQKNKRDRDRDKLSRLNEIVAALKSQVKELMVCPTVVGHPQFSHLSSSIVSREEDKAEEDRAEEDIAEEEKTEELPRDPKEKKNALHRKGNKRRRLALEASWKNASEEILYFQSVVDKLVLMKSPKNSDASDDHNNDSNESNDNGLSLKKRKR